MNWSSGENGCLEVSDGRTGGQTDKRIEKLTFPSVRPSVWKMSIKRTTNNFVRDNFVRSDGRTNSCPFETSTGSKCYQTNHLPLVDVNLNILHHEIEKFASYNIYLWGWNFYGWHSIFFFLHIFRMNRFHTKIPLNPFFLMLTNKFKYNIHFSIYSYAKSSRKNALKK